MRSVGGIVVTLLTGVAATGAQAREQRAQAAPPATPVRPDQNPDDPVTGPTAPETEFLDSEGRPLPPDIARELRERLRNVSPPSRTAPPGQPPAPARPSVPQSARDGEMTVTGQRPRGSVIGDIPPQETF